MAICCIITLYLVIQGDLNEKLKSGNVTALNLTGVEQLTDMFFAILYEKKVNFSHLFNLNLSGTLIVPCNRIVWSYNTAGLFLTFWGMWPMAHTLSIYFIMFKFV